MNTTGIRLTADDWQAMTKRCDAAVAGWVHSTNARKYTVRAIDAETLQRLALAAIGCGPDDMRPAELDAIAAHIAAEYVGNTYKPTAAQWHRITKVGR
jgi:hypothetical protein